MNFFIHFNIFTIIDISYSYYYFTFYSRSIWTSKLTIFDPFCMFQLTWFEGLSSESSRHLYTLFTQLKLFPHSSIYPHCIHSGEVVLLYLFFSCLFNAFYFCFTCTASFTARQWNKLIYFSLFPAACSIIDFPV